ncbi:MAG: hypothetical protein AAB830_01660 [Patescibacteria group bacterium]
MKFAKLFGWGIAIYAVMFLIWSGFITYGFTAGLQPKILAFCALIAMTILAGRSLHFSSWKDIAPYSLLWAVIIAILDAIFAVPLTGWGIYANASVLVGYALVFVVPLFTYERVAIVPDET